jgi:hypothetical protein
MMLSAEHGAALVSVLREDAKERLWKLLVSSCFDPRVEAETISWFYTLFPHVTNC